MSSGAPRRPPARRLRSAAVRLLLRLQGSRRYRRAAGALAGDCTVRRATAAERSHLARTRAETGHPKCGPHAEVVTYVAVRRDRIVGWEHLVIGDALSRFPGPWLFGVYVVGRCRGMGIGERLVRRAVASCRARGFDRVWLQVGTANAAAVALYRSAGFVVADDALWEQRMDEQSRRYGVRRVVMRADLR